jgi:hypothetical protein
MCFYRHYGQLFTASLRVNFKEEFTVLQYLQLEHQPCRLYSLTVMEGRIS